MQLDQPMVLRVISWFEQQTFGVCSWLGDKLRMRAASIRLFFIYASFLTIGSPVIIYFCAAFILRLKELIGRRKSRVWDL